MKIHLSFPLFLFAFSIFLSSHAQMGRLISVDTIGAPKASASVIKGNYFYLHSWDGPLDIYSLTNPAAPALVNSVDVGYGYYGRLGLYNDKIFVYDNALNFLRMVDISAPLNPVVTDSVPIPESTNSLMGPFMTHTATHTYIADYDTLYVVNTVDSSNIFMENKVVSPQIGTFGYGELVVFDTVLYVSNGGNIQIFNISNPAQPVYNAAFAPHYTDRLVQVWHLQVNPMDSLLYLGDWNWGHGHQTYDITNPLWPQYQWRGTGSSAHNYISYDQNLMVQSIANGGIGAFYIDQDSSYLMDTILCSMSSSSFPFDIDLKDNYIYITNPNGLEVVYLDTNLVGASEPSVSAADFVLFPNPATDFVNVHLPTTLKGTMLELWNLQGQLIREIQIVQNGLDNKVDLQDLPQGTYWLGLKQNGQRIGGKMVVKQ